MAQTAERASPTTTGRRRRAISARGARRPPTSPIPTSSPSIRASTQLAQPNAAIQRLWTGALWLEGPAWSAEGRYLVWSDIPNNRQLRWLEDDGRVSVFRMPSNNSNGNTFDFQGRQLSCEHLTRRVVRYELDGSATVLADSRTTASGSIRPTTWCRIRTAASGSPIRRMAASSTKARPMPRAARATRRQAQSAARPAGGDRHGFKRELPTQLLSRRSRAAGRARGHRGPGARSERHLLLARLQEALRRQHRQGPGRHRTGRQGRRSTCSTSAPTTSSPTSKLFTDCMVDGVKCGPDGMRCDVDGNLWCVEQCRPHRRLQRRDGVDARRAS